MRNVLVLLICLVVANISTTKADVVCQNVRTKTVKKVANKSCPPNYSLIFSLDSLNGKPGAQGSTGPAGINGKDGLTGATGATGECAVSINSYPSGTTLTGTFGNYTTVPIDHGDATVSAWASFPIPLPVSTPIYLAARWLLPICNGDLSTCVGSDLLSGPWLSSCGGSPREPAALPGVVCIYPWAARNFKDLRLWSAGYRNNDALYIRGFFLGWQASPNGMPLGFGFGTNTNDSFFEGTWAYTVP